MQDKLMLLCTSIFISTLLEFFPPPPKASFIINTLFPTLVITTVCHSHKILCLSVKLFTHAMFRHPSGGQNYGRGGCQIGNLWRQCGLDSSSCLAEPLKFISTSFNVCTYSSEVIMAPRFKNSCNKFPHCPTTH